MVAIHNDRVHVTGGGFPMANVAGELARMGITPPDPPEQRTSLEDIFISTAEDTGEEPAAGRPCVP